MLFRYQSGYSALVVMLDLSPPQRGRNDRSPFVEEDVSDVKSS